MSNLDAREMAVLQVRNYENEIILNTPNRNEILREGPPLDSKYNILGRGAYGTVFKAIFQAQQVAVKIVRNVKHANMQSMHNEANILGCKHRNIVKIFKIESTPNFGIVIMERLMGQCLQAVLDNVELPLMHRVFISLDILSALSYCHRRNLLHLDVKPQNVLVSVGSGIAKAHKENISPTLHRRRNYICKLCDFGASMKTDSPPSNSAKGSAKGTVRYMSPEALREEPLTGAADIYSLGITMWQLKQRRLPYHWIECNEIVAYQVVKHQLRPDRSSAQALSYCERAAELAQGKCFCHKPVPAEITYHSLEQIKQVLNRSKAPEEQLHFSECDVVGATGRALGGRRPFQALNAKANVMRDLRAELGLFTSIKERLQEPKCEEAISLRALFKDTAGKPDRFKELSYQAACKCCWCSDALLRPDSAALRERLMQLL